MKRRVIMVLLALGTLGGFGSGFASLGRCRHWREQHRQQVMSEFARTCVDAARAGHPGLPAAVPATPAALPPR